MRFVKPLIAIFAFLAVVLAGVALWVYSSVTTAVAHARTNDFVVIEKGSSPSAVIDKLASEGIIGSPRAMKIYLRVAADGSKIKAGEYRFESPITPLDVLKKLEQGEEKTAKLVIPGGFTRFDIAKRIIEKFPQTPAVDQKQVLLLMEDTSAIKDISPEARNLEGYMYPSTYSFPNETKPEAIVNAMVNQFRKVWRPEWNSRAKEMGRTPHEIVTIASLIETESGVESERPVVASVIYNRITREIPLGIDQTAVYIAKMQDRWDGTIHKSDLEADSPYNTRKYGGIPPGPISSVSESAIFAALNPAKTDYIYYVRNVQANDGSHWFYASAAEFERGKAEYQRWLEKERKLMRENERTVQ